MPDAEFPGWMADDLRKSSIDRASAQRLGIEPVSKDDCEAMLGFPVPGFSGGYAIPFRDPETGEPMCTRNGEKPFVRIRFERPVTIGESAAKYASPKGGGNRAYILPEVQGAAARGEEIVITEGEKKGICATQQGIPTIGLVGVWGFQDGGTKDLLEELQPYLAEGRRIVFVLDSDAAVNIGCLHAAHRLSEIARLRGCALRLCILPPHIEETGEPRAEKNGLDDAIMRYGAGRVRDLMAAAEPVTSTVAEIYERALEKYARTCKERGVPPETLVDEVLRKGFFDGLTAVQRRSVRTALQSAWPELVAEIEAGIQKRLVGEFADAAAPASGGEGLRHGCYVALPGQSDRWKVDALEGEVAWCCPENRRISRPFPRRLLQPIEAPSASAENGAQGGRPAGNSITAVANAFIAQVPLNRDGAFNIRILRGTWYWYRDGAYRRTEREQIEAEVMSFLRQHPDFHVLATRKIVADVAAHIAAADVGGLPSETRLPVEFLPAGETRPAPGWVAFSNLLVNIEALAAKINGTDIPDDDLVREPSARILTPYRFDFDFDPKAACPMFEQFLIDAQPGADAREAIQMLLGLLLVPDTHFNVFFFLVGRGGEGKSVLLYVIRKLIGDDNVCHLPFARFAEKHSSGLLTEHLVNVIGEGDTEMPKGAEHGRVEGILKDVCDGGLIPVEPKFCAPTKAPATARCIAAGNGIPTFYDRSEAIWDRLRVIPFDIRIRGTVREDPLLRQKIVGAELPGIMTFAIQGLAKLQGLDRFPEPEAWKRRKEEHRSRCDHEREFLSESYEVGDSALQVLSQAMFVEYRAWMGSRNYHALGEGRFAESVKRVFPGCEKVRVRDGSGRQITVWTGLRKTEVVA